MKHLKISHSMSLALSLALVAILVLTMVPVTLSLASDKPPSAPGLEGVSRPAAQAPVIIIDDGCVGCGGADGAGFERQCPAAQDPWICIACQRQVCWAYGGGALYAATDGLPRCWVGWRPTIVTAGRYKVEVSIPSYLQSKAKTQQARYTIQHADGIAQVTINQAAVGKTCPNSQEVWVDLGTYRFNAGTGGYVHIASDTPEIGRVIDADAARFTLINQPPNVPQQIAPANGSVTRNLSVTLKVQDRGDPDNYPRNYRDYYYRIEKTDGTWSRESGWMTNTTWTVTVPSRGTYRWRVRAGDGELASGWTGWWTLIVSIAEPVPPPTPPPGGSCPVPFYWQGDPRWASNHFGTCSCTIGGCGCAITSLAMLFKYYGINHDPGSLASCLGRSACPLAWSSACSGDKATYNGWKAFNWSLLETELQRGRPVILQLNRSGGMHFVVAVSGGGTRAQDYLVNDPALKQGTRIPLSAVLVRMNYTPNSMRLFSGAPSCQISGAGDESMLKISGIASTDLPAKQGDGAIVPSSTQPITGTVIMYRNTEADMTLELAAQSSVGNVTEMLIWTNSITNTTWQPFAQYAELPLSEEFFVRFRDDAGNVSVPISNTSDPVASPPESNAVFLPLIMR